MSCQSTFRHLRKPAFTLVELLVVIGIIALLISILMPSLTKARKSAQGIQCASNMRQIVCAMLNYSQDNRDVAIPYIMDGGLTPQYWRSGLDRYLGRRNQGASVGHYYDIPMWDCPLNITIRNAPPSNLRTTNYASYVVNQYIYNYDSQPLHRRVAIRRPSSKFLLLELNTTTPLAYWHAAFVSQFRFVPPDQSISPILGNGFFGHGGPGTNVGFVDCHVELMPKKADAFFYTGGSGTGYLENWALK